MKVTRTYFIPPAKVAEFITDCRKTHITEFTSQWSDEHKSFICTTTTDENYYDSVMQDLLDITLEHDLSYEQKDSINTAIACVKTLVEMGVIK